jgi:uncharacterized membrane protein
MGSHLVEVGARYYFNDVLRHCYEKRRYYTDLVVNISLVMAVIFIMFIGYLYAKNKKKEPPIDNTQRLLEEARQVYYEQQKQESELMRDMPPWGILPFEHE